MMATPMRSLPPRPVTQTGGAPSAGRTLPTPPSRGTSIRAGRGDISRPPGGTTIAGSPGGAGTRPLPVARPSAGATGVASRPATQALGSTPAASVGQVSRPTHGAPTTSPPTAPSGTTTSPFGVTLKRPPTPAVPRITSAHPSDRPLPASGMSRSLPNPSAHSRMTSLPVNSSVAGMNGRALSPPPVSNPSRLRPTQNDVRPGLDNAPPQNSAAHPSGISPKGPSSKSQSDDHAAVQTRRNVASSYTAPNESDNSADLRKFTSFYHSNSNNSRPTPNTNLRSALSSSSSSIPSFGGTSNGSGSAGGDEGRRERLRQEAVKELINTEQDYINDLQLVNEVFLKPLGSRNILEKQELGSLFSNMEMLEGVNQEIFKGLKDDPAGDRVGQVFLGVMHYFKMYTMYCANQPIALSTFEKCKTKNAAFAAFLDECMADPRCRGLTLGSYLIKPIQRLCKYPLILKTILQNTDESHGDHASLSEALKQMEKIVEYVNEGKRQAENSQKIMELQSSIDGGETLGLVQPTRRLLLENTLEVRVPKAKPRERHCVLFNDLFLCVKPKKKAGAGYYDPIVLSLQVAKFIEISDTDEVRNSFELQAESERGETKSVVLVLPSPELKAEWSKEIKKIIRSYQKQRLLAAKKDSGEKDGNSLRLSRGGKASPTVGRAAESTRF